MNKINEENINLFSHNSINKRKELENIYIPPNIESFSTFKKIIFLQGLLKELTSEKDRFEGIKEKMINKMNNNCYNYYKNKIGIKQIYDYCESNNPDIYIENILLPDSKFILLNKYEIIYQAFFILRNDNHKILKIINSLPSEYNKRLR